MKQLAIIFLVFSAVTTSQANAGQTETLLIDKLTKVFLSLPEGNPTKAKITLRLADLHAERGRLISKDELEKGCLQCSNGETDRRKSLEYYSYVLPDLKGDAKENVMVQVGHLHEVLGENSKAISFYQKVIQTSQGKGAAEAQFSLAEIYFKQRQFSQAQQYYGKALQNAHFKRRGLASFRQAWCLYNTGEISQAVSGLEEILKSPKLLSRGAGNLVSVDEDFKSEVAKDYTIFMAHDSVISIEAINKVYKLSPEKTRIENVSFLAKELERLGRVQQAEQAWELVVSKTASPEIRMEGLVYLAGLKLKGQAKSEILPYLKRAFRNWNILSTCSDQRQCDELKKRLRTLVFDWNRSEKDRPSPQLIEAYQGYFSVQAEDREAFELASQAALQAKDFDRAYQWNQRAFQLAKDKEVRESLLVRRIEIAELAKKSDWLMVSQNFYLENSTQKSKSTEIRYQMAQQAYEAKSFQEAANQFKALASHPGTPQKLKMQSAEMALDSLVLMKNDAMIEGWASEFAQLFPSKRKHFMSLAGQSVLTQTAALSLATDNDSLAAWNTLNRFDVQSADEEKKKTYFKNKIILARKLKKFDEMDKALRSYLSLAKLSKVETTFGLENKVWLSELQLNFVEAFNSYQKLKTENWLELARLADLAEKPSQQYYYNYLKTAADKDLAFSICVQLVKQAKEFAPKQKPCLPYLQTNPSFMASLLMEIYSGKKNSRQLEGLLKSYGLQDTPAARIVQRDLLLAKGEADLAKLKKHKLDGRTAQVAGSIQYRSKLLLNFEKTIIKATQTQDWLTQTLFLSELKNQYSRFYDELLALPAPQDLSPEEQQQYVTLLGQQASVFKEKVEQIDFKVNELWNSEDAITQLVADFHKAPQELQTLLGPQIEKMKQVATAEKSSLFDLVYRKNSVRPQPSLALLETARNQVKSAPLNKVALRNLIELETKRGYKPMIIYLNSRLKRVDQGFESEGASL